MFAHFKAIQDAVTLPILIYNIPGRCVVDMNIETMARLAKLPNIVGVKDSANDLARPLETRIAIGADFCQLSGDDITAAAFLGQGGHGVISVLSNIAPAESAQMQNAWMKKDYATFEALRDKLSMLARNLFCESNPAPLKYAASRLGLCTDEVRLPLIPASASAREKVDAAMEFAGLLPNGASKKAVNA
jgi:4-hydroxy-tetrahydrodipicolinate synthase